MMKKLKIGYIPISKDLSHPADRRRLLFFAKKDRHEIILDLNDKIDVLVLSEKSKKIDFILSDKKIPIILDLIDSYLTPNNIVEDYLRSWFKFLTGEEKSHYLSSKNLFIRLCKTVDAVICSTPEQRKIIENYNFNVHDILDSHSEFPDLKIESKKISEKLELFWEGLPYNFNGLKVIPKNNKINFNIVSDLEYYLYYGKLLKLPSNIYLQYLLKINKNCLNLKSWTLNNIIDVAKKSNIGVLPLDTTKKMNLFKAENRLLIMWRLGLPVICSNTHAYSRVLANLNNVGLINQESNWIEYTASIKKYYPDLIWQAEQGKKYLKLNHSDEVLLEKWRNVFREIV